MLHKVWCGKESKYQDRNWNTSLKYFHYFRVRNSIFMSKKIQTCFCVVVDSFNPSYSCYYAYHMLGSVFSNKQEYTANFAHVQKSRSCSEESRNCAGSTSYSLRAFHKPIPLLSEVTVCSHVRREEGSLFITW
jgi:hypothetical protein